MAALRSITHRFDADAPAAKHAALARLASLELAPTPALVAYHEALLFLAAHPSDAPMSAVVEAEFRRIARLLWHLRGRHPAHLEGHGLPWTDAVTRFSHDGLSGLLNNRECRVSFERWDTPLLDLNAVLRLTLPSLERDRTSAGLSNDDLLDALRVSPSARLRFIVDELARLDALPYVKDQLFDALDLFVRVSPVTRSFSKAWNRLPMPSAYRQRELLRRFDAMALMNQPLPPAREFDTAASARGVHVVKTTLALTGRETDPGTYMDPASLRVFDVEHGLAVAIYAMTPERQLPLESYAGFTLFKNGWPVAYGGAWLLGPRANFGMNIFEPYRGGESGFMMCQVLRVYRQCFGLRFIEVDAHQFGLDNPDGIASGAYWFYYRHGFRSLDAKLARLAEREQRRMAAVPGHRSAEPALLAFTGSNVALDFGGKRGPELADLTEAVTTWIARAHGGRRAEAEAAAVQRFMSRAPRRMTRLNAHETRVLTEVALLAAALAIEDTEDLALLARMVRAKPVDLLAYQRLLLRFFEMPFRPSSARRH